MFMLIEVSDPDKLHLLRHDESVRVVEVCRGETLADIANAVEDEEYRRCRARREQLERPPLPASTFADPDHEDADGAPVVAPRLPHPDDDTPLEAK